jgi:hypothetical protein
MALEQIQVRLDTELRATLQRKADEDHRPLSQYIRKLLADATRAPAAAGSESQAA